jgi:hypothetical protein|tara:strand:- start:581 stop:952 length:372 start_codon:yes stop_codon:yes gene_type:complete
MYSKIGVIFFALTLSAQAHDMSPAYPKFRYSQIEGVSVTRMSLYNKRNDASYYEIKVYTKNWDSVPFASAAKIIEVKHTKRYGFDVYVRNSDLDSITYICTMSKVSKKTNVPLISTKICSKVK